MLTKDCKQCGQTISKCSRDSKIQWAKRLYCSIACSGTSFKTGDAPWNYALKGFRAGEQSHLWKGGITTTIAKVRNSFEYRHWKKSVLKRDGKCLECNSTKNLTADHIQGFTKFPELRFEISNGRTLCWPCHAKQPDHGIKKLTNHQVRRIRLIKEVTPQLSNTKIGNLFGVSRSCVEAVLRGTNWAWLK